jgi:aspartate ammonia-lyase
MNSRVWQRSFEVKGAEFASMLKMGRTQMQDAVPMTLGQEFERSRTTLQEDVIASRNRSHLIREINLGATAIGTGINAPVGYAATGARSRGHLARAP